MLTNTKRTGIYLVLIVTALLVTLVILNTSNFRANTTPIGLNESTEPTPDAGEPCYIQLENGDAAEPCSCAEGAVPAPVPESVEEAKTAAVNEAAKLATEYDILGGKVKASVENGEISKAIKEKILPVVANTEFKSRQSAESELGKLFQEHVMPALQRKLGNVAVALLSRQTERSKNEGTGYFGTNYSYEVNKFSPLESYSSRFRNNSNINFTATTSIRPGNSLLVPTLTLSAVAEADISSTEMKVGASYDCFGRGTANGSVVFRGRLSDIELYVKIPFKFSANGVTLTGYFVPTYKLNGKSTVTTAALSWQFGK